MNAVPAFFATFGAVLLAELPDKSVVAGIVLTTRYRRPLAVWIGAASAFALHVVLAVTVGSFLRRLPERPLQIGVGLLFVVGAIVLWREHPGDGFGSGSAAPERLPFGRVAWRAAAVLGLAEFGDLTQLATAGLAGSTGEPVAVALGAWLALVSVAALAVVAGHWIERTLPLAIVRKLAAAVFATFGTVAVVLALT